MRLARGSLTANGAFRELLDGRGEWSVN